MSDIIINVYEKPDEEGWGWSIFVNDLKMWGSDDTSDEDVYSNNFDATEAALKIASFYTFEIIEAMGE